MEIKFKVSQVLMGFLVALWAILMPIKAFIVIIGFAVAIDTVTGIAASIRKNGWNSLISHKYFNIPIKLFFYFTAILLMHYIDIHVFGGEIIEIRLLITKSVTMVFIYIETKSFDENQKVFSGKSIPEWMREIYSRLKELKKGLTDLSE